MCSSIFLLMGTAVERYLAVCRPHHYRTVTSTWWWWWWCDISFFMVSDSVSKKLGNKKVFDSDWNLTSYTFAGSRQARPFNLVHPAKHFGCRAYEHPKVVITNYHHSHMIVIIVVISSITNVHLSILCMNTNIIVYIVYIISRPSS